MSITPFNPFNLLKKFFVYCKMGGNLGYKEDPSNWYSFDNLLK